MGQNPAPRACSSGVRRAGKLTNRGAKTGIRVPLGARGHNDMTSFSLTEGIAPELFRTGQVCRIRHHRTESNKYHKLSEVP